MSELGTAERRFKTCLLNFINDWTIGYLLDSTVDIVEPVAKTPRRTDSIFDCYRSISDDKTPINEAAAKELESTKLKYFKAISTDPTEFWKGAASENPHLARVAPSERDFNRARQIRTAKRAFFFLRQISGKLNCYERLQPMDLLNLDFYNFTFEFQFIFYL